MLLESCYLTVDLLKLLRILEPIGAAVWSILAGQVEVTASLTGGVAIALYVSGVTGLEECGFSSPNIP